MNGQQLKNSILQWAIQGKLVLQDPSEGTAEDLLKDIRAEKEQLVKDGKLKKKDLVTSNIYKDADGKWYETIGKETTEITEDIPFEIPDGWRWVRPKYISQFVGGYAYKSNEFLSKSNYQVLRLGNVKQTGLKLEASPVFISEKLAIQTSKYKCQVNDILFTMTGTRKKRDYFFTVRIRENDTNFFINQRVGCYRPFIGNLSLWFIYVLKTEFIFEQVFKHETGTANQGNIGSDNVMSILIPLPPLSEQRRIVAKIEELMPLVEKYGKSQEKLDKLNEAIYSQLEKSILQEAIQGKLVPQLAEEGTAEQLLAVIRAEKERLVKEGKLSKKDLLTSNIYKEDDKWFETTGKETKDITEEIPFDVPERWRWLRFSHFSYIYTGNSINENEKASKYTKVEGMEYIGTKDVEFNHTINYQNGVCIPDSYINNFRIAPSASILMCIEGGSAGRKIAKLSKDVCFGNKLCCFNPYVKVHDFIYYYLQTALFREVFQSNKTGIIGGVSVNTIKTLLVPLPPLAEQRRIVAKIEELMKVIKK